MFSHLKMLRPASGFFFLLAAAFFALPFLPDAALAITHSAPADTLFIGRFSEVEPDTEEGEDRL
ncbi:MAG: hypothetical protein ACOC2C_02970, partial [Cyclonatronaceae bacterium]